MDLYPQRLNVVCTCKQSVMWQLHGQDSKQLGDCQGVRHEWLLGLRFTVSSPSEVRKIELDLVPALIQAHGHRANEWLDSGS